MLYLGADIGFFFLYHLVRYRRKVVRDNLVKSFPEKTPKEIKTIEKKFYHNFCDLFAETLKLRRMTMEQVLEHLTFVNPELLNELYQKQKSVFLATQHSGNWEFESVFCHLLANTKQLSHCNSTLYSFYKRLCMLFVVFCFSSGYTSSIFLVHAEQFLCCCLLWCCWSSG